MAVGDLAPADGAVQAKVDSHSGTAVLLGVCFLPHALVLLQILYTATPGPGEELYLCVRKEHPDGQCVPGWDLPPLARADSALPQASRSPA